jgi:hypothetical protein
VVVPFLHASMGYDHPTVYLRRQIITAGGMSCTCDKIATNAVSSMSRTSVFCPSPYRSPNASRRASFRPAGCRGPERSAVFPLLGMVSGRRSAHEGWSQKMRQTDDRHPAIPRGADDSASARQKSLRLPAFRSYRDVRSSTA